MNRIKSTVIVLLILSVVLVTFPQVNLVKAEPNTLVVPDDYGSIQEAINSATGGDTVYVKKGIYHENLGINKPIFFIGEDRDETIIDGNTSQSYRVPININTSNVTVSGFTLSYGYAGIQFHGVGNCTISGNRIINGQFGIRGGTWNNITDNIFENIGVGGAIRFDGSTHNFVHKNYFSSCNEGVQIMWGSNYNTVTENTIVNCKNQGVRLQESDWNMVTKNTIKNNGIGISIYRANTNFIEQNNFIDNNQEVVASESYALAWGYGYSLNSWKENYWSNYNGSDNDKDGIGDTPYEINEVNRDNYPQIEPIDMLVLIPEFPSWLPEDQSYQEITIRTDGSIEPDTNLLERNGNTYTFKGDIFGTIMVQKGSITIDGAGHTLQGKKEVGNVDERGVYLVGPDRSSPSCRNVVVKNLRIVNFWEGIFCIGSSNNSIIGNYFENAGIHLLGSPNFSPDLIKGNIFNGSVIFVDYNTGGTDVITENNFLDGYVIVGLSAVPIVERNYWSDYNGTDSDGDGIGDTPYVSSYVLDEPVYDNYPLMSPLYIEIISEYPSWTPLVAGFFVITVLSLFYKHQFNQWGRK